ncbi:MAG: hypothetical protein QOI10_2927 [Solirubrobacterales bacterium]|jgi:hypothetical protein|nr:hypothetical protein [Solirubrobacterales bacterium]
MIKRAGGTRGFRVRLLVALVAVLCVGVTGIAVANNLDRGTAQNAARFAAKQKCKATAGCTGYGASNVRLVTHHKAVGKIFVNVTRNGVKFQCRNQVVITLNPENGAVRFFLSHRRCVQL